MTTTDQRIYNGYIGFRTPDDFLIRFETFSKTIGRNRSQVARYFLSECLSAYEGDAAAVTKIRQAII
jgi:hypothetical protein